MVAAPADLHGSIDYEVIDGIITLNGFVPGLMTKRYAGVLAWWIPGSRDVINGIAVTSDEADGADKIAEAVDLVIEKNPYLNAAQVKVGVRNRTVRLTGFLPSEEQKRMAENDAWCVFGVDDVVNEIEVGG
ncbi:MAG: BON domain-containing protein [Notoacmeibacter sp.]|nr:BON domain-containing protein [Notoacmeibacter sp.]